MAQLAAVSRHLDGFRRTSDASQGGQSSVQELNLVHLKHEATHSIANFGLMVSYLSNSFHWYYKSTQLCTSLPRRARCYLCHSSTVPTTTAWHIHYCGYGVADVSSRRPSLLPDVKMINCAYKQLRRTFVLHFAVCRSPLHLICRFS
jgi:hypothetical protein